MSTQDSSWKSQAGFIWSLMGSAVGFANILSFSAQVYKNGGGAFLVPYVIALFILGIPLLILEGVIGKSYKEPLVTAYGQTLGLPGKVFGWLAVLACLTIGGFYIVLTGYSVAYTYFSATGSIPEDSKTFFIHTFLKATGSITEVGELSIPIFLATVCVALVTWLILSKNVKDGIEKVCSTFMPLLAVIVLFFAVMVSFLPGGAQGWYFYLKPDMSKLLDPYLWRDVFGQLFFSLSLGLGIIVGYSRHSDEKINIPKAMLYVALGDFFVSFISGAAIFGCLAHISYVQGIAFDSILTTDSTFEIGFIIFPKIFQHFGPLLGNLLGVIFFFCLFIAGITGVFSIVESIAGNIGREYSLSRRRSVFLTLSAMTLIATLFCMGNASHLMDALVPMVLGTNMLIGGIAIITIFGLMHSKVSQSPVWQTQNGQTLYGFCLKNLAPFILVAILVCNLWQEAEFNELAQTIRWGWLLTAVCISFMLSYAKSRKRSIAPA